jgi:rRNA maturation RNase YbeY
MGASFSFMVKPSVRFGYADRTLPLSGKRRVQQFVADIFRLEGKAPCRLQYVFCSDDYLHGMNVSFLQHDDYTDIITFDLSEGSHSSIDGEIYISVDRVRANALELGIPFREEILRVIFHGALHLCGYGDKTRSAKAVMRGREDYYLQLFGFHVERKRIAESEKRTRFT